VTMDPYCTLKERRSPFELLNATFPIIFADRWLSRKERDAVREREDNLRRKKEDKRKERTVTIDLLGRRVIDDKPAVVDVYEEARLEEDRRAAEASAAAAEAVAGLFTRTFRQGGAYVACCWGKNCPSVAYLHFLHTPQPGRMAARSLTTPCWKASPRGQNSGPRPSFTTFLSARRNRREEKSGFKTSLSQR